MGHRHDDDANGGIAGAGHNESRHLENPYDDWDEIANDRLLAKIETEHPLTESIEEEEETFIEDSNMNQYYDFSTTNSSSAPSPGPRLSSYSPDNNNLTIQQQQTSINNNNPQTNNSNIHDNNSYNNHINNPLTNNPHIDTDVKDRNDNNIDEIINTNTSTNRFQQQKQHHFAITRDGKFDHIFERKLKYQLNLLLSNHVKSEQIDCNDRSMYTGLPGITLLYQHLCNKHNLDSKLRDQVAAKTANHVNQYLTIISSQHMHNTKCSSFLCGELGVIALCALAKTQQRLHREMLTRTLSYPGPGIALSQSAPSTPGVLGAELISSCQKSALQHQHNVLNGAPMHTTHHNIEQINLEPDTTKLLEKILELIKLQENQGTPDELLYGRTGGLYAMLLIKQQLPKQTIIKDEHITHHINLMLKSGQTMESFGRPLFYSWHGKEYVGAAHGYAGILYMLLEAHKYLNEDQLKLIRDAINLVLSVRYPSCNYPSSMGSQTDRLVHWCHGAPGVIHMLIKAYQVYKEPSLLESAISCGDLIWQRGLLKKGFSLCHGISGNAYAFLHLYQLTRDRKHLYRAGKFGQFYLDHGSSIAWRADSPASLFEGYAGLAYFLADLLTPSEAKFPAFQLTNSFPLEQDQIRETTN